MVKEKSKRNISIKLLKRPLLLLSLFLFTSMVYTKTQKGLASYYGQHWTGRLTSSGERFHADSLTAAHTYYKFGTILKVTNHHNDSVCFVKVNDRLPKGSRFIIDLSYGTARKLNFIRRGVIPVTIEAVDTVPIKK